MNNLRSRAYAGLFLVLVTIFLSILGLPLPGLAGSGGDGDGSAGAALSDVGVPDAAVTGEFFYGDGTGGDPVFTESPPAPPSCTPKTECGVTTHPNCSTSGTYDPLEPGCGPTLPTECTPSTRCGVSGEVSELQVSNGSS